MALVCNHLDCTKANSKPWIAHPSTPIKYLLVNCLMVCVCVCLSLHAAAGSSSVLKEGGAGGLSHFAVNAQLDRDAIAALALASGLDLPANIDGAGRGDHPEGNNAYADGEGGYYDGGGGADSDDGDHGPGLDVDALEGAVRAGAGDAARLQQLQEQPDGGSYEELCRWVRLRFLNHVVVVQFWKCKSEACLLTAKLGV